MKNKTFYITTPIYYPSANPHVGTAYTTVLADALVRYKKLLGYEAFFTTGSDEHALKILNNAKKANKTPMEFVNTMVTVFKELWQRLDINYDAFIRTTDAIHEVTVKQIYEKLAASGLIEERVWTGWYCNSCEENYAMNNIVKKEEKFFCNQGHELVQRDEISLFFKMSAFTQWIQDYLTKEHPNFIVPQSRINELLNSFINAGLEDLSITRISSDWGIEVLSDKYGKEGKHYVAYVWVDALFSYLSALGYLSNDDQNFQKYWNGEDSVIIHLMSKEITRFHAIYWPIFLNVLGVKQPTKIISHGWIVTPEGKMSKSLGNIIDPNEYINNYGSDALRFFFIKGLTLTNDSTFTKQRFIDIYNNYLANSFGNLSNRVLAMVKKYFNGKIPAITFFNYYMPNYLELAQTCAPSLNQAIEDDDLDKVVEILYAINQKVNELIEQEKPWELFKANQTLKLEELIHYLCNVVRFIYFYLSPILVKASPLVLKAYGLDLKQINQDNLKNFNQVNNQLVSDLPILFPRIEK